MKEVLIHIRQCDILTSVASDKTVQPTLKLRSSKHCSVSSLTLITLKRLAKALVRLRVCAGWSETLLVAHTTLLEISCTGSILYCQPLPRMFLTWQIAKTLMIRRIWVYFICKYSRSECISHAQQLCTLIQASYTTVILHFDKQVNNDLMGEFRFSGIFFTIAWGMIG